MNGEVRTFCAVVILVSLSAASGCGDGKPSVDTALTEATVSGTVKINGKTATKGTISFDPSNYQRKDAKPASALIGKDGSFTLTTLVGENAVSVSSPEINRDRKLSYNRQSIVVADGPNSITVELPPPSKQWPWHTFRLPPGAVETCATLYRTARQHPCFGGDRAMSTRRTFFMQGGAGIVAATTLERAGATIAAATGQTLRIGAIGCGSRGTYLAATFARLKGIELAYVCDPDESRAIAAANAIAKITGKAPKPVSDLRRVLDDKSVDGLTRFDPAGSRTPRSRSGTSRPPSAIWATSRHGSVAPSPSTPHTEQIVGDQRAASLSKRPYREGHWAVPEGT